MFSYLNPIPSFPEYAGLHRVGSSEFEIPISEIPSESPIPDERITSIKFRAYYPTHSDATSRENVYWLPSPQREWKRAYASFAGAGPRLAGALSILPNIMSYISIPAVQNAPLLTSATPYPVVIFSHGLGGNANGYSSILGNLASCGIICIAPEHRDGSCPVAFAKTEAGESVHSANVFSYRRVAHTPTPEVLDERNRQLRIRLWELELLYTTLTKLNDGVALKTFSTPNTNLSFTSALDLTPSSVTWAGHSFGAATTVQFIKSIFYHASLPTNLSGPPLYTTPVTSPLIAQITSSSPLILLDLWTMPLAGPLTQWLWDLPLPCYAASSPHASSVISIMSTQFTRYTSILHRTKAVLSSDPVATLAKLEANTEVNTKNDEEPELTDSDSTASTTSLVSDSSPSSSSSSSLSSSSSPSSNNAPLLFVVPQSAHLSQSDFGPLFPYLSKRFAKAENPHRTIQLNVRAILQTMREKGLRVGCGVLGAAVDDEKEGWDAEILRGTGATGLLRLGLDD